MSGQEVGTAYVRIRPQMSSFKAETQSGIRNAFGTVGKILLPTIAFAGVTEGIRKSVKAAELKQVFQGQLEQAFRQVGLSFSQFQPQVDAAIKNQQRLGFVFDESAQAMTRSVRATGSVNIALKLQSAAADLARGQNISLIQATQVLVRAYNGQTTGLKRLGITVDKHAKGLAVLDAVQRKFAGSAEKYAASAAGSQERLTAAISETEALIGSAFLPTVTSLNTRLADWLNNTENQKKIQHLTNQAVAEGGKIIHGFADAIKTVAPPLKFVVNLLGGFGHLAETALIVGLLTKLKRSTAGWTEMAAASARARTKIVADAAAEKAALSGVAATAGSASAGVGGSAKVGGGATGAASLAAVANAALVETALKDVAQSEQQIVDAATSSTAEYTAESLRSSKERSGAAITSAKEQTVANTAVATSTKPVIAGNDGIALSSTAATEKVVANNAAQVASYGTVTLATERLQAAALKAIAPIGAARGAIANTLPKALGLVSRATSITLGAYIADSLIAGLTGFDPAKALLKALKPGPSVSQQLAESTKGLASARTAIPAAKLAKDEAQLAVETARVTLAQSSASHSSLSYRTLVDTLQAKVQELKTAQKSYADLLDQRKGSVDTFSKAIFHLAENERKGTAVNIAAARSATAIESGEHRAADAARNTASSLRDLAQTNRELSPLQRHNIRLLAEFYDRLKAIPSDTQIKLFLDNRDALASINEVLAGLNLVRQNIFSSVTSPLTNAFRTAASTAGERGLPGQQHTLPFSPSQIIQNRLAETTGQTSAARIAALQAAKAEAAKRAAFAQSLALPEHAKTRKEQQKHLGQYRQALQDEAAAQSEIDSINAQHAADAKSARDKAAAAARAAAAAARAAREKAKRAAEKVRRAYESHIADEAAALKRTAAKVRSSGLGTAGADGSGAPALIARIRAADNAEIAFYRREAHDMKLTAAERRNFKNLIVSTRQQESHDITAIRVSVQKRKEDMLSLEISMAELAVKTGGGSLSHLNALQQKERNLEKKLLREQVKRFTERANDLKLSVAARLKASQSANAAEDQLLTLTKQQKAKSEYTLSQLANYAAGEFATYGSNIGGKGSSLSPQDERAAFARELGKAVKGVKQASVVIQHFNYHKDPYAAMRSAKQANEHFYSGGV